MTNATSDSGELAHAISIAARPEAAHCVMKSPHPTTWTLKSAFGLVPGAISAP